MSWGPLTVNSTNSHLLEQNRQIKVYLKIFVFVSLLAFLVLEKQIKNLKMTELCFCLQFGFLNPKRGICTMQSGFLRKKGKMSAVKWVTLLWEAMMCIHELWLVQETQPSAGATEPRARLGSLSSWSLYTLLPFSTMKKTQPHPLWAYSRMGYRW